MSDKPFLSDIQTIRDRARKHIEQGAVTPGYAADRDTVIRLLNEALATEIERGKRDQRDAPPRDPDEPKGG